MFYRDVLGFIELGSGIGTAMFGVPGSTRPLITVEERAGVRPVPPQRRLGLFHFAILLPSRGALAGTLVHLHEQGIQMGMSDHLVSEALYLSDPDGLGIEIYSDRPRSTWRTQGGELAMATEPLDVEGLMREPGAAMWSGMPAGTVIGHMHLHVGDIPGAERFYAGVIGFDVTVRSYPGALFLSAGGYHHHLGTNTWARDATPPAADEAQLLHWELVVPTRDELGVVGNRLVSSGAEVTEDGASAIIARDPFGTLIRIASEL
jgi:catechol 2,3-dioxygenase